MESIQSKKISIKFKDTRYTNKAQRIDLLLN